MGFDMTQAKVGDKLLTRGGEVLTLVDIERDAKHYPFILQTEDDCVFSVTNQGNRYLEEETDYDIVGFADEQPTETASENKGVKSDQREHSHYFKDVRHLDFIDVYRVIDLWELKDPALQHALKKLLVPGNRGHKDIQKDVQDVIDSCKRWQEMQAENGTKENCKP